MAPYLLSSGSKESRQAVLKYLGITNESMARFVSAVLTWLKAQKHLPEVTSDILIEKFLILNKFNIENTKYAIDMYYTVRTTFPELYEDKNPQLYHMREIANVTYFLSLPKLTKDLSCITIFKLADADPKRFVAYDFFAHTFNVSEIKLQECYATSEVLMYDLEGLKSGHFFKLTPNALRKSATVAEEVFSMKLVQIHFVNCPTFMDNLLRIVKAVLKPKIASRIHVHRNFDTLYNFIPKEILPEDYGGKEKSLEELNEQLGAKFVQYEERFKTLDNLRVNEALRSTRPKNARHPIGNFKNLCLD